MTDTDVANGRADTEPAKKAVAKHAIIDASGSEVEQEELATGIRYTLLANGQTFDYQTGGEPGKPLTMLAIFGAKTLATNESSQARNNPKGAGTADEQIEAVRERFALIGTGQWVDRTREGVGATMDLDKLADAIVDVATAQGKVADRAAVRQRCEDKDYRAAARKVPAVAAKYAELVGRQTKSIDDLLGGLTA